MTGSGAAPLETPRTLDRSASSMPGTWSSATNTGGAPPIEVTWCRTASSTYFDRVEAHVDDRRRAGHHHAVEVADRAHRVEPRRQVDDPGLAEPGRVLVGAEHLADGHVAGLVQLRHGAVGPARRLQHVGDDVAVRQLDALADAGRPAGVGEVREVGRRVEVGVEVPVGGIAAQQVGEVDVAVGSRPSSRAAKSRMCASPVTTTVRTGVCARAPRTKGSTWSQVTSTVAPASVSWAARSGGRQQRVGGGEGGPGQQDPVVERRVLPAVGDVHRDDVAPPDRRGRPATPRRRARAAPSSV